MHGIVSALERRGLLRRPTTAPSGRARRAVLTQAGTQAFTDARDAMRALQDRAFSGLNKADTTALRRSLEHIIAQTTDG